MKMIIVLVYLVVGVVVASFKDYLGDIGSVGDVINLALAILLWPLVLLGVDFNLKIGDGGGENGKDEGGDKKKGALLMVGPVLAYGHAAATKLRRRFSKAASANDASPEGSP